MYLRINLLIFSWLTIINNFITINNYAFFKQSQIAFYVNFFLSEAFYSNLSINIYKLINNKDIFSI